jgi:hypothetical protein
MSERSAEQVVREYLTYLRDPGQLVHNGFSIRLRAKLATETDAINQLRLLSAIELVEQIDGETLEEEFVAVARGYALEAGVTPGSFRKLGVSDQVLRAAGLLVDSHVVDLRTIAENDHSNHIEGPTAGTDQAMNDDQGPDEAVPLLAQPGDFSDHMSVTRRGRDVLIDGGDGWELPPRVLNGEHERHVAVGTTAMLLAPEADEAVVVDTADIASYRSSAPEARGKRMTQAQIKNMLPDKPFTLKELVELTGASLVTIRKSVLSLQDRNFVKCVGQDPTHKGPGRAPMRYAKL